MKELLRTNDIVLISFVEALMNEQNIEYLVLDQNMSVLEGSIGAIPRRVLVETDQFEKARMILKEANLADELKGKTT